MGEGAGDIGEHAYVILKAGARHSEALDVSHCGSVEVVGSGGT
jgi:hypothetical protein